MSEVLNLVASHKFASKDAREELDGCAGHLNKSDVVRKVRARILKIPDPLFLSQKPNIALEMAERAVDAEIKKKVRLRFIDSNGQIDYLAFNERLIPLGNGIYVHQKDANVLDMMKKMDHQDVNVKTAINRAEIEKEIMKPIMRYMSEHGVDRCYDACEQMGLL